MIELIKYNKSGFTLIEITIALLILAVGLVGILTLFPIGFEASTRAARITEATFLAQALIEDLKREGYDGDTVKDALPIAEGGLGPQVGTSGKYRSEIVAANEIAGTLRQVIVTVYWTVGETAAGAVIERNIELRTYIANYEP